jgi:O-antigen/teichoic acid export membrane protein
MIRAPVVGVGTSTGGEKAWARRISLVVAITLLSRFVGFLYPVLVLRQLGPDAAGLVVVFLNSAYFFVQPVGGPTMAMVGPIAAAPSDDERAQWLRAAMAALVPSVAFAVAFATVACITSRLPLLPMLLMVAGLSADTLYFQLLTARLRYTAAATYRLIANVAQLAALVLVVALGFESVTLVVGIFALSYVFGLAVVELRYRVLVALVLRAVVATRRQRRRLMVTAIPVALTGLAYSAITALDIYLVRLARPDVVAAYGAAKTLAAPFLLVSLAVTAIAQPEAARADVSQAAAIRRRILLLGSGCGAFAIAICWSLAPYAVDLVYGHRYPHAAATLRWLGAGATLMGIHVLLQAWCWGRQRYSLPLISLCTGAGIAVVCNLLLVPSHGAQGAGVAGCVGAAVATIMLVPLSRTTNGRESELLPHATSEPLHPMQPPVETHLRPGASSPTAGAA